MPDIIRGLRHVVLYETIKKTMPDLVPIKSESALDHYYLLDIMSAFYDMQNQRNLVIQN